MFRDINSYFRIVCGAKTVTNFQMTYVTVLTSTETTRQDGEVKRLSLINYDILEILDCLALIQKQSQYKGESRAISINNPFTPLHTPPSNITYYFYTEAEDNQCLVSNPNPLDCNITPTPPPKKSCFFNYQSCNVIVCQSKWRGMASPSSQVGGIFSRVILYSAGDSLEHSWPSTLSTKVDSPT